MTIQPFRIMVMCSFVSERCTDATDATDVAIQFSNAEARVQYGKDVDVQATVERPYLYMLGQSSSSTEDQIKFVPARHDNLENLIQKVKTVENVEAEDEMR